MLRISSARAYVALAVCADAPGHTSRSHDVRQPAHILASLAPWWQGCWALCFPSVTTQWDLFTASFVLASKRAGRPLRWKSGLEVCGQRTKKTKALRHGKSRDHVWLANHHESNYSRFSSGASGCLWHALVKRLAEMLADDETVLILLGQKPVAALISLKQLKLLEYAEERVLDDIDLKASETILKARKWPSWDEVEKQCRS